MLINDDIRLLPQTSHVTIHRLNSLGIRNCWNLINFFPFRYEDYSLVSNIAKIQEGEIVTIKGSIVSVKPVFTKNGYKTQNIVIQDQTGQIEVIWFNQLYLLRIFKVGLNISISGKVTQYRGKLTIQPSEYEIIPGLTAPTIHTGRIIPVYSERKGLSTKTIRQKIKYLTDDVDFIESIPEPFPGEIIKYNQLLPESAAYSQIHAPKTLLLADKARYRLAFDEMFQLQLRTTLVKKEWEKNRVGHKLDIYSRAIQEKIIGFIAGLPFTLTSAQKKVIDEILTDLSQDKPMNRFLQGDVGSGKTVVAAIAAFATYLNGYQTLIMAPTEILAQQHYLTIINLFKNQKVKVGLLTGSKKLASINKLDIIIGTHALLTNNIKLNKVGTVVIDEQHRFGVAQRHNLKEKGINPHLLSMTATPIPRTIWLTVYGELDLSIIDEMPVGRKPVKTYLIPKEKRQSCYQWIKKQIRENKTQAFVICPLINESNTETLQSVKAAKKEFVELQNNVFPEYRIGLLHGKLKTAEKDSIMAGFKDGKYGILISTSVVEVGIDIPNASIMLIEGAERFGLAQLHQLRGRVGRDNAQAYCFLFTDQDKPEIKKRLTFFCKNNKGVDLAEYDLKIRGPGDIFGLAQHGFLNLKIASFSDLELIKTTKKAVNYFIQKYPLLNKFPELKSRLKEIDHVPDVARD